jgi:hypothetical protein
LVACLVQTSGHVVQSSPATSVVSSRRAHTISLLTLRLASASFSEDSSKAAFARRPASRSRMLHSKIGPPVTDADESLWLLIVVLHKWGGKC